VSVEGRDDAKPVPRHHVGEGAVQAVVAAPQNAPIAQQERQAAEIRTQFDGAVRAQKFPGEDDVGAARALEFAQAGADLADLEARVREGGRHGLGEFVDGDDVVVAATLDASVRDLQRQFAGAGDDSQLRLFGRHAVSVRVSRFGMQSGRLPPARTKLTISMTSTLLAKSSATSARRSWKVPSWAKSKR
jgi:multidrug efflux pump subunit AcrA (membrane-fusion protein)